MLKRTFYFMLMGFALMGLIGQGIANPGACSSAAKSNMEMSNCNEMDMAEPSGKSKESSDCCGSDCTAMLHCSQTTATFLGSAAFTETIAAKAMSHALRPLGKPAGMHSIPEIKPPITV